MKLNDAFDRESDPDKVLEELLAPLRQLEPSMETRVRNRVTVANTLSRLQLTDKKPRRPWWGRTLSIPVPIAAALLIAAGLTFMCDHRSWQETQAVAPVQSAIQTSQPANIDRDAASPSAPQPVVRHQESETYLCGVGRLKSESDYFTQE